MTRTLTDLDSRRGVFARRLDAIVYGGPTSGGVARQREELLVLGTGRCPSTVAVQLPRDPDERARARHRLPPHQLDGDTALLILEDAPLLINVRSAGDAAPVRTVLIVQPKNPFLHP